MVRISSIGSPGNEGVAPSKKSPDMKSWRACWKLEAEIGELRLEAGGSL